MKIAIVGSRDVTVSDIGRHISNAEEGGIHQSICSLVRRERFVFGKMDDKVLPLQVGS